MGRESVGSVRSMVIGRGHLRRSLRGTSRGSTKSACARERPRDQQTAGVRHGPSGISGALSSAWAAPVETFVIYLDGLDPEFNPKEQRSPAPLMGPVKTYGEQIAGLIHQFWGLLTSKPDPPLFTARLVLRGTALHGPVGQLYQQINNLKEELIGAIKQVVSEGRRPNTDQILAMWHDLRGRRAEHSGLAVQHFNLDRHDVDRYLRRTRRRWSLSVYVALTHPCSG